MMSSVRVAFAAVAFVAFDARANEPLRVTLTFDDALKDHLLIAAPMLEERGWRGTFNIVTDWVGMNEKHLTWEDVRELIRRGHEVTTHTKSHRNLVKLLEEGKADEVRAEFAASRDAIADNTGFTPRFMCSPFVAQNEETSRLCREANLRQMNAPRCNFGEGSDGKVRSVIEDFIVRGEQRLDILHHGVSAADHGGWRPFADRAAFGRHLDMIAALERDGRIIVTDYDGMMSRCALRAKAWPHHGVIALSFDDKNLAAWEAAFPLFAKYGATATFCVSGVIGTNEVSFARKALLAGHELALHGRQHANADDALAKKGADRYWASEMEPQISACKAAGISVRSFAYPNCRHTQATDELFFCHGFTRVRGSIPGVTGPNPHDPKGLKLDQWKPVADFDPLFTPATAFLNERNISNVIMGESYHTDIEDVVRAMNRAGERAELLSIVSHGIAPDAKKINMKTEWLERMLSTADGAGVIVRGLR